MLVLVEGRLSIRPYESKSGEKHRAAEVVMARMQMLTRSSDDPTVETDESPIDELDAIA